MKSVKLLYNLSGIGLIATVLLHGFLYIIPGATDWLAYVLIALFVGGIVVGVLPMAFLMSPKEKAVSPSRPKGWGFFRYSPPWLSTVVIVGILYGGMHFALLFLRDEEGHRILERHRYRPETITGKELVVYQAYQKRLIQSLFGGFIMIYSLPLQLIGSRLYDSVESFFVAIGTFEGHIVRNVAPVLLKPCKQGNLDSMIDALNSSSPQFRDTFIGALHCASDSRAVLPFLTLLDDRPSPCQDLLFLLLKHVCRYPKILVFGHYGIEQFDHRKTVWNPDVSKLTISMPHVKRMIIDTGTYDFYALEQFLTYAVNYLGYPYLKKYVVAEIVGDPEKLHINIRNNLTTVCKQVIMHT